MAPIVSSGCVDMSGNAWKWGNLMSALSTDMVHVWRAELNQPDSVLEELSKWLTPDEVNRAARFRFRQLASRFIVCRGTLRAILAQYLGLHARELCFVYTPYGKPSLVTVDESAPLQFNLSHSGGLALYAIARDRPVGIDIEVLRPDVELERLAKHFFSPQEQAELFTLPSQARTEAFFRCWVRKEAYVKGRGEGLSLPLNTFTVSIGGNTAELLAAADPADPLRWSLHDITGCPSYIAAVAAFGQNWLPVCFEWLRE